MLKRTKLSRKGTSPLKKAKDAANKAFSLYIRTRDCYFSIEGMVGHCFTCNKLFPMEYLQCGHFIQGRHGSTLYLENNAHAQCMQCNVFKHGNLVVYYRRMKEKYGQATIDLLEELDKEPSHYKLADYLEIAKTFTNKLNEL